MILLNTDNCWQLTGLQDQVSGDYIDNASVSATLYNIQGTSLYTLTGAYLDGSNGNYLITLPAANTTTLDSGGEYILSIVATEGGVQRSWNSTELALQGGVQ